MTNNDKCKSCGAAIRWAITDNEKRMPLDAEPNPAGNMVLFDRWHENNGHRTSVECVRLADMFDHGKPRYMPHHATCPDAEQWRRK